MRMGSHFSRFVAAVRTMVRNHIRVSRIGPPVASVRYIAELKSYILANRWTEVGATPEVTEASKMEYERRLAALVNVFYYTIWDDAHL